MKDLQIFENAQFGQIRTIVTENGEPLFCLADVTNILGLGGGRWNVKDRLHFDGVVTIKGSKPVISHGVDTGRTREIPMTFINEPNLYKCIFQSRKKQAEAFQEWVYNEVLPSIRKSGGYMVAHKDETPEELMSRALIVAKATIARQHEAINDARQKVATLDTENQNLSKQVSDLEQSNREMLPSAIFAKAVETSGRSILVNELARVLKQNGIDLGQNRLFAWLRDHNYLCTKGEMWNMPTQKAMDLGLFEVKKVIIQNPYGESLVRNTTKVTGRGQVYFVNKFLKEGGKA